MANWMKTRGFQRTVEVSRMRLVKRRRMPGACTMCTAMFGNGAAIGMVRCRAEVLAIRRERCLGSTKFFEAGRGVWRRRAAVRHIAFGTSLDIGIIRSGFEWRWLRWSEGQRFAAATAHELRFTRKPEGVIKGEGALK